jgi:peptide/nickel transport system substrate-binding protein
VPEGPDNSDRTLNVVQVSPISSLNPNIESNRSSVRVAESILETATKYVLDDSGEGLELVPSLAESWTQIDATTWEFKVRPDVEFSNGEKLTAQAFADSLAFWRADKAGGHFIVHQNIEIEVVDDLTFNVITSTPDYGPLLAQMSYFHVFAPAYAAEVGPEEFGAAPIGTGPYVLKDWQQGVSIELEANPTYWGDAPKIKHIVIRSVTDDATRVAEIETGSADIVMDLAPDMLQRTEDLPDAHVESARPYYRVFLALKEESGPLSDVRVRQAINYAIDREGISASLFQGHSFPLYGTFVQGEPGYDEDFEGYRYDPDKAEDLLDEAGYDGSEISLNYTIGSSLLDSKVAEAVQAQLEAVGIKVKMVGGPPTITQGWRLPEASGAFMLTFTPVYPDSSFIFKAYFAQNSAWAAFATAPELDEFALESISTTDPSEREAVFLDAQDYIMNDEALWAPLYQVEENSGVADDVVWTARPDSKYDFAHAEFK